jgi:hypothetical protein
LVVHVGGRLRAVRLIGVNRSGPEYACAGPDGEGGKGFDFFQGPADDRSIKAIAGWEVNAVALPLNEACWLGGYGGLKQQYSGPAYRRAIATYVRRLHHRGMYVVLRLSGAAPAAHTYGFDNGSTEIPMADADHSPAFWRSVATYFRRDRAVLFHLFDEPHDITWQCARNGCDTADDGHAGSPGYGAYRAAGHQALLEAIRHRGARQPIIVSGIDYATGLDRWEHYAPRDRLRQLVVDFNFFDFSGSLSPFEPQLRRMARRHPVVVGGFGDTDCNSDFSAHLMHLADRAHISYFAWTWNTEADYGGCSNALLGPFSAYYSGAPSGYGRGVRSHYRALRARRQLDRRRG